MAEQPKNAGYPNLPPSATSAGAASKPSQYFTTPNFPHFRGDYTATPVSPLAKAASASASAKSIQPNPLTLN